MPKKNSSPRDTDDREIISTRVFSTTRAHLWQAFAEPARLAQWWGPKGFTNTFHTFEFRPGGRWRFAMHGPDGTTYENEATFVETLPLDRIVFHLEPIHRFQMTISLNDQTVGTEVTWRMRFDSAAECTRVKPFITAANEENFDRLKSHLAATA